jgi:[ribosomal protein S18]-alanine N-acetyltransferase
LAGDKRALGAIYRIEPMMQEDVAEVSRVERRCFSNPWPSSAYRRELRSPDQNYYVVLRAFPSAEQDETNRRSSNGSLSDRVVDGPWVRPRLPLLSFGRKTAPEPDGTRLAGFAGMWIMYDEAHITTIGVDPDFRGQGLGELLLVAMIDEALRRGATWITLEVRVSNDLAQRLYRKYGFIVQGTRRHYYSDNGEDAYIMWSRSLKDFEYLEELSKLKQSILARLGNRLLPQVERSRARSTG